MSRDMFAELGPARYTELAVRAQDYIHEDTGTTDEFVEVFAHPADINPSWYEAVRRNAVDHEDAIDVAQRFDDDQRREYLRMLRRDFSHAEAVAMCRPSLADRTPK